MTSVFSVRRSVGLAASVIFALSAARAVAAEHLGHEAPAATTLSTRWTGVYIGGDVGYAFANDTYTLDPIFFPALPVNSSNLFASRGISGGALVGANLVVIPRWLVGIEADWSWQHIVTQLSSPNFFGVVMTAKQPWSESVRGRIGFLTTPSSLVYITAGWAKSKVELSTDVVFGPLTLTSSGTIHGWQVGGGIETAITDDWHARLEYLQTFYSSAGVDQPLLPLIAEIKPTVGLARAALIYQLGIDGIGADAAASPPVHAAWNGLYAGASIGGAFGYSDVNILSGFGDQVKGIGLAGPLVSAFIGVNYQLASRWLIGAEAEIAPSVRSTDLKLGAMEAGRARFGLLLAPDTLAYLSAGWMGTAFDNLTTNGFVLVAGQHVDGAQIGGGVEVAATDEWHVRFDYQYSIMQKINVILPFNPTPVPATVEPRGQVGRIAIVRQFGGL